ncbi:hypothetical protein EDB83DRAFT_2317438 [Lactarius deliciosus]|nr:hypothetical protein EDB83DRAFT_2317438 [Lactarius deliciosus]
MTKVEGMGEETGTEQPKDGQSGAEFGRRWARCDDKEGVVPRWRDGEEEGRRDDAENCGERDSVREITGMSKREGEVAGRWAGQGYVGKERAVRVAPRATMIPGVTERSNFRVPGAPSTGVPALREYKKRTGEDLTAHPLAAEIQGCDSPEAILTVLEGKVDELNQSRSSDERLTKWLNPTVNIINALSATLGEGAGLVFPPTKIIFSGIGILLVAAKSTVASRDVPFKLFDRIESFFERLRIYTKAPPSPAVTDELAKIMAEVLSILAIATKQMKERRSKTFIKKLAGMNGIEDALRRFDELERRELLTGMAQVTSDTSVLKDDAKETKADARETKVMVKEIADKMDARDCGHSGRGTTEAEKVAVSA